MNIDLDNWQQTVLNTEGNVVLRSGRQVGKSTIVSIKAGEYAVNNPKKNILVIACVERQALLLFEKVLSYIYINHKKMIKKGKHRPTKHKLTLTNGSVIHCLPTGLSGYGIRGYTIDLLIADEAAFIPEDVWTAVTPMLAVTRGNIILLSTPFGKGGYFFRCFSDPTFTSFHVSSEDCPRKNQEFLDQEKSRMSKIQYAQEYLGEFVDELKRFFPTELIKKCMVIVRQNGDELIQRDGLISQGDTAVPMDTFLGVDVARMGRDDSVLFSLALKESILSQIDMDITSKTHLPETVRAIVDADKKWDYKTIYIDDGGMGVGVFDPLLELDQTKRKVEAINNNSRSIDNDKKRKKLLKEDLYNNLLSLMETDRIRLFDEPEILLSLSSIQSEYVNGKLRIFGNYTHITEALIRAAWCVKNERQNIWIR